MTDHDRYVRDMKAGSITLVGLFVFAILCVLGAFVCAPRPAHAQQPGSLGPAGRSYYWQGGPAVRVSDGGTGGHSAAEARRWLGVPFIGGYDAIPGSWEMTGSLVTPYTLATDSSFWFRDDVDTTKKLKMKLDGLPSTGLAQLVVTQAGIDTIAFTNKTPQRFLTDQYFFDGPHIYDETYDCKLWNGLDFAIGQALVQLPDPHSGTLGCTMAVFDNSGVDNYLYNGRSDAVNMPYTHLTDSRLVIHDEADTSKRVAIQASGVSTGTTRTLTSPDASGTIALTSMLPATAGTAVYDPLLRVKDTQFFVKNASDTTKKLQVDLGNFTTSTTRTDSLPNASTMLAGAGVANVFRDQQWIRPSTDVTSLRLVSPSAATANALEAYSADLGAVTSYIDPAGFNVAPAFAIREVGGSSTLTVQNKSAISASRTYSIDNSITSTDFAMTGGTQTISGAKTISGASFMTGAGGANVDGTASRFVFRDQSDNTKKAAFNLSQITTSTTRTDTIPDVSGQLVVRINKRDFASQTANISSTTIASPAAGNYLVTVYGVVTGVLGAGVTVTLGWTDPQQAQTATQTFATAAGSFVSMIQVVRVASGNITLASSGYSSGTYSVYATVTGPL